MVSAILNREASFACSMKYYAQIYMIINTCFPCADRIVSFGSLEVEDESVEDLICNSVCTGDSDNTESHEWTQLKLDGFYSVIGVLQNGFDI